MKVLFSLFLSFSLVATATAADVKEVSVTFIVDNSGSTQGGYHQSIADAGIDLFLGLGALKSDWTFQLYSHDEKQDRIARFSSDEFSGIEAVREYKAAFKNLGWTGSYEEALIRRFTSLLDSKADLLGSGKSAVVLFTDASEQSETKVAKVVKAVAKAVNGDLDRFKFHAVLWAKDLGCEPGNEPVWDYKASIYERVVEALDGQVHTLCSKDASHFSDIMTAVAKSLK